MKLKILIAVLFFVLCNAAEPPCNRAFKCSLQDDPAWATDGKKCYVFRNPCHLANENCHRQNSYTPVLQVITKNKCQTLCNSVCSENFQPVCGYYNNEKREFSNQCQMNYHICSTGETYSVYNEGRCEEPLTLS